ERNPLGHLSYTSSRLGHRGSRQCESFPQYQAGHQNDATPDSSRVAKPTCLLHHLQRIPADERAQPESPELIRAVALETTTRFEDFGWTLYFPAMRQTRRVGS